MSKKKILLIVVALVIVAVGIIAAVISQKEKEMDPEELLERFEKAAEEVLGEDVQRVSQTELVATLTCTEVKPTGVNLWAVHCRLAFYIAILNAVSIAHIESESCFINSVITLERCGDCVVCRIVGHLKGNAAINGF